MANKIKFKRGLKSKLPTLDAGEPAFLTDTRELFVGTGSGNVNISGSRAATYIVAASNSVHKETADYICDGTADQVEINAAINALPATGGKVLLLEGTYNCTDTINVSGTSVLEGTGRENTRINGSLSVRGCVRCLRVTQIIAVSAEICYCYIYNPNGTSLICGGDTFIHDNYFDVDEGSCIKLTVCLNGNTTRNTVINNIFSYGHIEVSGDGYNVICNNTINHTKYGIDISEGSSNNVVLNNVLYTDESGAVAVKDNGSNTQKANNFILEDV